MNSRITRETWYVDMRAERKKAGITQQEMSAQTGLRQARISEIENGHVDPKISELLAIAEVVGLAVHAFPTRYEESIKYAILECVEVEDRGTGSRTIPEIILGDRLYL